MKHWILQGNPDFFRLTDYVAENENINWTVRQRHFAKEMGIGDEVFIWRAAGSRKAQAGVIAVCRILEEPTVRGEDPTALSYWENPEAVSSELRVRLHVERRCVRTKEVVKKEWLIDDPTLRDLRILRLANETVYRVKPDQADRLRRLAENTGGDWSRNECVAGLWAFAETEGKQVSKLPGSPVASVAVAIGRAVGGVYNKVMNFRSVDPREPRAGLSSTNEIDHAVWKEFYDASAKQLRTDLLNAEYHRLWQTSSPPPVARKQVYEDYGEAPNDDPSQLSRFARKVRLGQPAFRRKLLRLYGGKCAISGWSPKEVLEAAHICEHAATGINHSGNGILLRSDLHHLMDANLLRIDCETLRVEIDPRLEHTPYWAFHGVRIADRTDGTQVSTDYVRTRWSATTTRLEILAT